jgi:hypothetical protein
MRSHLVRSFCEIYITMHGSMKIKLIYLFGLFNIPTRMAFHYLKC